MITKDLGAVTAYAEAVEAGYTGTEEEYSELLASYATVAQNAAASASAAAQSATDAAGSATSAAASATEASTTVSGAIANIEAAGDAQVDLVTAEGTTQVGLVSAEGAIQVSSVDAKGAEVIESIPEDYTELSADVTQLKSDFSEITGNQPIEMVSSRVIQMVDGGSVTMVDGVPQYSSTSSSYSCGMMKCTGGDVFTVSGHGGATPRLWGFIDSNGNVLAVANAETTQTDLVLTAPDNSAWIIIHTNDGRTSYSGEIVHTALKRLDLITDVMKSLSLNYYINGFITTTEGTLYENQSYKATDYILFDNNSTISLIDVYTGEASSAIAFYDLNKNFISAITNVKGNYTAESIPLDVAYIRCSSRAINEKPKAYVGNNALISEKLDNKVADTTLKNTQILIFGDSITDTCNFTINSDNETTAVSWKNPSNTYTDAQGNLIGFSMWPKILKINQPCKEIRNYARSGASYKTSVKPSGEERQNLQYQIDVAINDRYNPNNVFDVDDFEPDIVIFALGTNDGDPNDTYGSAMAKTVYKSDGVTIDVDATIANLDDTKFCESARKAYMRIKQAFPLAQLFCVLPIQRADNDTNFGTLRAYLSEMVRRYGGIIIDGTAESGVTRDFNNWNALGIYLKDGLHPNDKGQNMMARMILASLKSHYVPFGTGFNPMN